MTHDDIWQEKLKIDKEQRNARIQFCKTYNSEIYYPALNKIQEECEKLGHSFEYTGDNFLKTYEYYECMYCGKTKIKEL